MHRVKQNILHTQVEIRVQKEDFMLTQEYARLRTNNCGAVQIFCGLVRDFDKHTQLGKLRALEIEHYHAMALKSLSHIAKNAITKWHPHKLIIVHRYGLLAPGDQIVMVGCASSHRDSTFATTKYIMDFLKTDAPFWKKNHTEHAKASWVQVNAHDIQTKNHWDES